MSDAEKRWRPTADIDALRARAELLRLARAFFTDRGLLEVETPVLGEFGVTDPNIAGVEVRLDAPSNARRFLQTSPEYAMKRLLAAGSPDIWQICRVFRNGESGRRHRPEFTMIEWYRLGWSLDAIIAETCELIVALLAMTKPAAANTPVTVHRYADLFQAATGLDPIDASLDDLRACARDLVAGLADAQALGDLRQNWLDLLMSHVVQSSLPASGLSVVRQYPAEQAALARLDPEDARYAERFEILMNGLELANGYHELTDATEQRVRFAADRRRRAAAGLPDVAEDALLLGALDHGLPDCSGVSVGFDRVLMCALGAESIDDVVSFPV